MTKKLCNGTHGVYVDGSGVDCRYGSRNGKAALATCALLCIESPPSKIKIGPLQHCEQCAATIKSSGKMDGCIGWLAKADLKKYLDAIKSRHPTEFMMNGLTKVPIDLKFQHIISVYTCSRLCHHNPKGKPLAHDTSEDRHAGRQIPERRWCPLYPRVIADVNSELMKAMWAVKDRVMTAILPSIYYAQIAYRNISNQGNDTPNEGIGGRNLVRANDDLLDVVNINLLWRGDDSSVRGPAGRQSSHLDGEGYRIIAIIPLQCHTRGYDFFFYPKSHRLDWTYSSSLESKRILDEFPAELAEEILANINEIIIFSERLLHAGGTCSSSEGSKVSSPITFTDTIKKSKKNGKPDVDGEKFNNWFGGGKNKVAGTQPTDVAVQFSIELRLLPNNGSSKGNGGDNLWTDNERWNWKGNPRESDLQKRLDKLPNDVEKANDGFVTAMKKAEERWLDCLKNNEAYVAESRG